MYTVNLLGLGALTATALGGCLLSLWIYFSLLFDKFSSLNSVCNSVFISNFHMQCYVPNCGISNTHTMKVEDSLVL